MKILNNKKGDVAMETVVFLAVILSLALLLVFAYNASSNYINGVNEALSKINTNKTQAEIQQENTEIQQEHYDLMIND